MSGGLGSAGIHSHRNVPLDVFGGSSYLFIKIIIIMMTDLIFVKKKLRQTKYANRRVFCDICYFSQQNSIKT